MNWFCKGCIYTGMCGFLLLAECPAGKKEKIHLEHVHTETQSGPAKIIVAGVTTNSATNYYQSFRVM